MKTGVRKQMRALLKSLSPDQIADRSRRACRLMAKLPEFQSAGVVMVYLSLPEEVDTTALVLDAFKAGKTVLAPKVSWEHRHMEALEVRSLETGLATTTKGPPVREPVYGEPWPVEEIDFVVIPALAFDRRGNRLGRGMGFYDRFLSGNRLHAFKCGLAFAEQVVDAVPVGDNDVPVDALVTDAQSLRFQRSH